MARNDLSFPHSLDIILINPYQLTNAGFPPRQIRTSTKVHREQGPRITLIELETEADVPNVEEEMLQEKVDFSKKNCPISLALSGLELRVAVRLV